MPPIRLGLYALAAALLTSAFWASFAVALVRSAQPAEDTLDTWLPVSADGAPSPREFPTAVWTGDEVIVWGGMGCSGPCGDGARYDPVADTWTRLPDKDAPRARHRHQAVWTGTEMLIWGGYGSNETVQMTSGARYSPATDSWDAMAPGSPTFGFGSVSGQAVWGGNEMLVWGGSQGGGRYDPVTDTWRPVSATGAPRGAGAAVVWTGSEMLVWGGGLYNPRSRFSAIATPLEEGGRYDPATDSWKPTATAGAPSPRLGHLAVWTGTEMLIWGGGQYTPENNGARYDPATDTWSAVSSVGAPSPRSGASAVWTGTEMLVWGGVDQSVHRLGDGAAYNPTTDTWRPILAEGALGPREAHTAVWTGCAMLIWGGFNGTLLSDGAKYFPLPA
jgi:N-acetylneuraminic acid mutarotase